MVPTVAAAPPIDLLTCPVDVLPLLVAAVIADDLLEEGELSLVPHLDHVADLLREAERPGAGRGGPGRRVQRGAAPAERLPAAIGYHHRHRRGSHRIGATRNRKSSIELDAENVLTTMKLSADARMEA